MIECWRRCEVKRLDAAVLKFLCKASNAISKWLLLDGHYLSVAVFIIATVTSLAIGSAMVYIGAVDPNPQIADVRMRSAILGMLTFLSVSYIAIAIREPLSNLLQLADAGETAVGPWFAISVRWIFVAMFAINLVLAAFGHGSWWSMSDALLIGLGLMLLSCESVDSERTVKG